MNQNIRLILCALAMLSVGACVAERPQTEQASISQEFYVEDTNSLSQLEDEISTEEPEVVIDYADDEFLSAIEKSILWRMENSENKDYSVLVNTELAFLGSFGEKDFADPVLNELAQKYIDGLNLQAEALTQQLYSDYQLLWQQGCVYRFEALVALYNNYNFLTDNAEFVGTYVSDLEETRELYNAYVAIEEDIESQSQNLNDIGYYGVSSSGLLYFTLTNNTNYTFDTTFEFVLMDENGTIIGNTETYIEDIKPGASYNVTYCDVQEGYDVYNFQGSNYYNDVRW